MGEYRGPEVGEYRGPRGGEYDGPIQPSGGGISWPPTDKILNPPSGSFYVGDIAGSTANSFNVAAASRAVACGGTCYYPQWCAVWQEGAASPRSIKYSQGLWNSSTHSIDWSTPVTISTIPGSDNINPVVVIDGSNNCCIAWVCLDGTTWKIKFQKRNSSGAFIAGTDKELSMCPGVIPSTAALTSHRYDTSNKDNLALTWALSTGGVAAALFNGTTYQWNSPFLLSPSGQAVSLSQSKTGGASRYALLLSPSGPLYALSTIALPTSAPVPPAPSLVSPANFSTNVSSTPTLSWSCMIGAESYLVQLSSMQDFSVLDVDESNYPSTSYNVAEPLLPGITYYWRVQAQNTSGTGEWSSPAWNFATTPPNGLYAPKLSGSNYLYQGSYRPRLSWSATGTTYKLYRYICTYPGPHCSDYTGQLLVYQGTAQSFIDYGVFIDNLDPNRVVYYYVYALNSSGQSSLRSNKVTYNEHLYWKAGVHGEKEELPTETGLAQNYPNPFNPTTKIEYQLAVSGYVRLSIFNILGEEIARLADGDHAAGYYTAVWDGGAAPSGIYYARIAVTDPSRNELYRRVTKLLLMK